MLLFIQIVVAVVFPTFGIRGVGLRISFSFWSKGCWALNLQGRFALQQIPGTFVAALGALVAALGALALSLGALA